MAHREVGAAHPGISPEPGQVKATGQALQPAQGRGDTDTGRQSWPGSGGTGQAAGQGGPEGPSQPGGEGGCGLQPREQREETGWNTPERDTLTGGSVAWGHTPQSPLNQTRRLWPPAPASRQWLWGRLWALLP